MDNHQTSQSPDALRHQLTAIALTLANEDPEMLDTMLNDLTGEFQPQTTVERLLVVEMAHGKWHQYRTWLAETSSLNKKMAATLVTDTFETFDESQKVNAASFTPNGPTPPTVPSTDPSPLTNG